MNEQRLTAFVQIATGIALLLGLGLVWLELRQAKSLTLAELTSQGFSEVVENSRSIMGEESAAVLSKSCLAPESLTHEDFVILEAYFSAQSTQVDRLRVLEAVAEFGVPWQIYAEQLLSNVLSHEFGRWWFEENLASDEQLAAVRDRIMRSNPDCKTSYDGFIHR